MPYLSSIPQNDVGHSWEDRHEIVAMLGVWRIWDHKRLVMIAATAELAKHDMSYSHTKDGRGILGMDIGSDIGVIYLALLGWSPYPRPYCGSTSCGLA